MRLEDIACPCGAAVEPVQDDNGVFLRCADGCAAVDAPAAPGLSSAIDAWMAALPMPSIEECLETFAFNSAGALVRAQSPQELVALAPLAQTLISYLQLLTTNSTPAGE